MSARNPWLQNTATRRYLARYYAGIPFTETLDPDVHDSVAGALQTTTVAKPGGERTISADAVDLADTYALVIFSHSPKDNHRAGHVAGQFVSELNEWADANGYLRGLQNGYEWGTLSAAPLALEAGTERVAERLATWHAGDDVGLADPPQHHYALATPDTVPTDEEHEALVYATERAPADITVTDEGALLIEELDDPRADFQRFTDCLVVLNRAEAIETDLGTQTSWGYEVGTVGPTVDEDARAALRERARDLAPTPDPEADSSDSEAADSEVKI